MRIQFRFKESRVNGVTINYQITAFSFFFLSSIRSSFYPSPVTVTVVKLKLKSRSSSSWTGDSARGVNLLKLLDYFFFLHVFPVFLSIIIHAMLCNRSYFDFPVFSASFLLEFNGRLYCYSSSTFGRFLVDFCPRDFSGMAERIFLKISDLISYHVESTPIEWC